LVTNQTERRACFGCLIDEWQSSRSIRSYAFSPLNGRPAFRSIEWRLARYRLSVQQVATSRFYEVQSSTGRTPENSADRGRAYLWQSFAFYPLNFYFRNWTSKHNQCHRNASPVDLTVKQISGRRSSAADSRSIAAQAACLILSVNQAARFIVSVMCVAASSTAFTDTSAIRRLLCRARSKVSRSRSVWTAAKS
jgi:hypothetical protein